MPNPARRGPARQKTSRKARAARRAAHPQPQIQPQAQAPAAETPTVARPMAPRAERPQPARAAAPAATSGQPNYSYVTGDLRRTGILIGVVAAILIILSIVLR